MAYVPRTADIISLSDQLCRVEKLSENRVKLVPVVSSDANRAFQVSGHPHWTSRSVVEESAIFIASFQVQAIN